MFVLDLIKGDDESNEKGFELANIRNYRVFVKLRLGGVTRYRIIRTIIGLPINTTDVRVLSITRLIVNNYYLLIDFQTDTLEYLRALHGIR